MHKNTIKKNTIDKNKIQKNFELFWKAYPRKVGQGQAERAFSKALRANLTEADALAEQIIQGAENLALDPNLPPAQFIPYPATWLNRSGWLDEPYPTRELTTDEKRERDLAESRAKAEREREYTRAMLKEYEATESYEIVKCDHGKTLAMCYQCSKKLANE